MSTRFRIQRRLYLACLTVALASTACAPAVSPTPSTNPNGSQSPDASPPSSSIPPQAQASAGSSSDRPVQIVDFAFQPELVTVHEGTTVTWTNYGSIAFSGLVMGNADHTITFDRLGVGSGLLNHLQSYSIIFDKAGTYAYDCRIHERMHGTVTVIR